MPTPQHASAAASPAAQHEGSGAASDAEDDDDAFSRSTAPRAKKLPGPHDEPHGKGMMAAKPFTGAIHAPSDAPAAVKHAAEQGLSLEWVYGFRAFDSKSNLVCNSQGHLVYPVAGVCVVVDPVSRTQRHFLGHSDDVRCLALNPAEGQRDWIVSGQNATVDERGHSTAPHVCVWNSADVDAAHYKLPLPVGSRAVRCVAFSPCGHFVAAVANDDDHTLSVWDWRHKAQLASTPTDKSAVLQVRFNPTHRPDDASYELVSVGVKHAYVWTWGVGGAAIRGKRIALGGQFPLQTWNSVCFTGTGSTVCGGFDGTLLLMKAGAGTASKSYPVNAHTGSAKAAKVFTLDSFHGGVVAGLSDKSVVVFDTKLAPVKTFTFDFKVTAVHARPGTKDLVVGTQGGQVYFIPDGLEASVEAGPVEPRFQALTHGHMDGELWACVSTRDGSKAYTAGEDNQLLLWDLHTHQLLRRGVLSAKKGLAPKVKKAATSSLFPQNQCARAMALAPDQAQLVLGTNDGSISVFDAHSLEPIAHVDLNQYGQRKVVNQEGNWIQAMHYSPSGHLLAVGTHGSVIVLLDPKAHYKVVGTITAHHSYISALDWSTDGETLRSNCGALELLFHAVSADGHAKQITSATSVKDTQWATHTCAISWGALGCVPEHDASFVNGVDRSPDGALLAAAQDDGRVAVYRYPVPSAHGVAYHEYKGHSSHVTSARFTADGARLLSTGGHDLALFQWKVGAYDAAALGRTHTLEHH